jgi:uncharacterized membrane protein YedE/YeeE
VTGYWAWWLGAPALALIAIAFPLLVSKPLGVSGAVARLLRWRKEGRAEREDERLPSNEQALLEAMMAATAAQFGAEALRESPVEAKDERASTVVSTPGRSVPRLANLAFLAAIVLGGVAGRLTSGTPWGRLALQEDFARLVSHGTGGFALLFVGGLLVGFGTRLSGGCTSGHGLSGCSRFQPASLLATAAFFGAGAAVALLLSRLA